MAKSKNPFAISVKANTEISREIRRVVVFDPPLAQVGRQFELVGRPTPYLHGCRGEASKTLEVLGQNVNPHSFEKHLGSYH